MQSSASTYVADMCAGQVMDLTDDERYIVACRLPKGR